MKLNPRRKPASQADVKKAADKAKNEAVATACAIFMFVMREKFGWGEKRLTRLWNEVNSLAVQVSNGEVKVAEIEAVLRDEYGIEVK